MEIIEPPPPPYVTVKLTHREAIDLMMVTGRFSGAHDDTANGTTSKLYNMLRELGLKPTDDDRLRLSGMYYHTPPSSE